MQFPSGQCMKALSRDLRYRSTPSLNGCATSWLVREHARVDGLSPPTRGSPPVHG